MNGLKKVSSSLHLPSTIYYKPVSDPYDDILMRLIDEIYTKTPFYGSRRITHMLKRIGHD